MTRALDPGEVAVIVGLAVPLHLASIDEAGFPHITPLWFEWDDGAFWMTSLWHRPHLRRLVTNPLAAICIDVEEGERDDGQRPNRQVRATGTAEVFEDLHAERTRRITEKYLSGPGLEAMLRKRTRGRRMVIRLTPMHLIAVASV